MTSTRLRAEDDRGDVLLDGLLRTVGVVVVFCLLLFEAGAVGLNVVQLDELAGDLAREAAAELPDRADARVLQAIAEQHVRDELASTPEVVLQALEVSGAHEVSVTLTRAPRTAVLRHTPLATRVPQSITASGRPPTM